jgi:hypothetical protein
VRRDIRVESSRCNQLFPEMEEMLIEKVRQWTFLYDMKSPDYRDQHMRANTWEEIGKELSSHDMRIACPQLLIHTHGMDNCSSLCCPVNRELASMDQIGLWNSLL